MAFGSFFGYGGGMENVAYGAVVVFTASLIAGTFRYLAERGRRSDADARAKDAASPPGIIDVDPSRRL